MSAVCHLCGRKKIGITTLHLMKHAQKLPNNTLYVIDAPIAIFLCHECLYELYQAVYVQVLAASYAKLEHVID